MTVNFQTWLEYRDVETMFGFQQNIPKDDDDIESELPVNLFSIQAFTDYLSRKHLDDKECFHPFLELVKWGTNTGAIKVRVTPNFDIHVEKLSLDLESEPIWITKRVFSLNEQKYAGKEDTVANDVFSEVQKVNQEEIDSPDKDYKNLPGLVKELTQNIQLKNPVFIFQQVKEVSKYNHIIQFGLSGSGRGKIVTKTRRGFTPLMLVDCSYIPSKGLIHIIINTVSGEGESSSWEVDVPYFEGFFMPSQKRQEIIDCVCTAFKYY